MAGGLTVRLPRDVQDDLDRYCAQTGAVKNRAVVIALRLFLGDQPTPRLRSRYARVCHSHCGSFYPVTPVRGWWRSLT